MMVRCTVFDTRHECNACVTGLRNNQAYIIDNNLIAGQIDDLLDETFWTVVPDKKKYYKLSTVSKSFGNSQISIMNYKLNHCIKKNHVNYDLNDKQRYNTIHNMFFLIKIQHYYFNKII